MAFDVIYTGVGSAERIPDLKVLREAESKFYDTIAAKDEQAYERRKSSEKELLELSKTDPVLLITDANRKEQAFELAKYNNTVTRMAIDAGGPEKLDMYQKLKIRQMRDAVEMKQNTLLADQERYLAEKEVVDKDIKGFYNKDTFKQAEKQFYATGKYPTSGLIAAPQDFVTAIKRMNLTGTETPSTFTEEVGGVGWRRDVTTNMTLDEAKRVIGDQVLQNEGYLMKVLQDADDPKNARDVEKYLMEYDVNKNGILDPKEKASAMAEPMNLNNPILKWAQDYYAPQIITQKTGTSKRITSAQSGGGGNYELSYGGGKTKYAAPIGEQAIVGSTNYELFPWYKKTPMSISLNGARVLSQNGDYVLNQDQTIQGLDFVGVGKKSDGSVEFLFKLPSDNYMNIGEPAGTNIAVPASRMQNLQDITVESNGRLVKVRDLMKGRKTTTTSKSKKTSSYDKYKRPVK